MNETKCKFNYGIQECIDYSKSSLDRYAADFDTLDNKALGIIGISSFLAGIQAFNIDTIIELVKYLISNGFCWLPFLSLMSLIAHFALLISCITFALRVYRVRDFNYPDDIYKLPVDDGNKDKLLQEIVETYTASSNELARINTEKADDLRISIKCILWAVIVLVVFMLFMIFYKCRLCLNFVNKGN